MLRAGIVGLPNVGKSTLFNALTRTRKAEAANYPFCTIEPNVGVVTVPDARLDTLATISRTTKIVPTTIEFVDIAGLVSGASQGEGLGNKFLQHIREVDAIVEVVRCFESRDVVHVSGAIDPLSDIETIKTELVLADLETVARSRDKAEKTARGGDRDARALLAVAEKLERHLDAGKRALTLELEPEEKEIARRLFLLTSRPMIFAANVGEDDLAKSGELPRVDAVRRYAETHVGTEAVVVSAEIEAQLALFQNTGLRLSHLNSHQHLHMFPPVFQIVRRLTRGMDNVWIRNPAGPWRKSPDVRMGRWVQRLGLNLTCLSAQALHRSRVPQMPDGMYGFEVGGCLTRSALEQILRKIPDGLYELICHPGEDDADTQTRYSHWGYRWAEELEALTAPETRVVLKEQGIALTSFVRSTGNRCNAVFR